MTNEPKTMREIHEIRLRNYEAERNLTRDELAMKRKADIDKTKRIIEKYNLKVKGA